MSCFVLVHGAWHGGWCWRSVLPRLREAGHTAVAPDLPAHGDDETPVDQVDLDGYADRINEVVEAQSEPVILVGHSMAGLAITHAAERSPSRLRMLVYLAAYIPLAGRSLADQAMEDPGSLMQQHLIVDPVSGLADTDPLVRRECFYADCSDEDYAFASARLRVDPLMPLLTPIRPTAERWGRIPRAYIECSKDRTVTVDLQRRIHSQSNCNYVYRMDTSHSPFFSAPDELVGHLLHAESLAG